MPVWMLPAIVSTTPPIFFRPTPLRCTARLGGGRHIHPHTGAGMAPNVNVAHSVADPRDLRAGRPVTVTVALERELDESEPVPKVPSPPPPLSFVPPGVGK